MRSSRDRPTSINGIEFDLLTDKLPKLFGGMHGLQAAIELDRCVDTAVSKQPPYGLVVSRAVLEIDRRRGMSELVRRNPESYRLLDPLGNLDAEHNSRLRPTALAREQPGGIRSVKHRRPEIMDVFVDEIGQGLVELEVEIDAVLHIIMRENEPVGHVQPARLDKILAQLDADQIGKANGREGEDRDGNSELRRDSSFDRRMVLGQARLLHENMRQGDDFVPESSGQ